MNREPSRRKVLHVLVAGAGSAAMTSGLAAAAGSLTGRVCVLTPKAIEGPFYFDPKLVRSDITEGKGGVPVEVRLQVVDGGCQPLPNARVDLWHCDARGVYSNYPGQGDDPRHPVGAVGQTYLRGTQFADGNGVVSFASVYPGWYPGRSAHMHFKAFVSDHAALTGQIFFPDAVSESIYARVASYGGRDRRGYLRNRDDLIARSVGRRATADVAATGSSYLVSLVIGVDPRG